MVSKYLIYALVDPRDLQWRYIGKSSSGMRRPLVHIMPSDLKRSGNCHKANWIKQLIKAGLRYNIEIIEEFSDSTKLCDAERDWIAECRRVGVPLTNFTDGGDGQSEGFRHSAEARLKMSASRKGKKIIKSKEALEKNAEMLRKRQNDRDYLIRIAKKRGLSPIWDCFGNRFELISDAAKYYNVPHQNIRSIFKGERFFINDDITFCKNIDEVDGLVDRMKSARFNAYSKGRKGRIVSRASVLEMSRSRGGKPFVDQNGNRYETLADGALAAKSDPSSILKCLKGKLRSVKGFVFSWL